MKLLFVFVITLFFSFELLSQAETNASVKMFNLEYSNALKNNDATAFSKLVRDYELIKIDGEYFIGVLALVDENFIDQTSLADLEVKNDTKIADLWTFRVPISKFNSFLNVQGIKYVEVGEPVSEDLIDDLPSTRADSVHAGLGGLLQSYTGKDVVICVIDWGFDYTHPTFYDTTFSKLRLTRAWDQNKFVGTPPEGYNFGVEYAGTEELLAAGSDTTYVFGSGSHGAHVAGIAGGAGAGQGYVGSAPESELIFISLRRDAPSLIDAFSYAINYAASVNKPIVFNMSFGSHLGPHDGTSLKNYGIDILHGPGKIFVGSAGNNGSSNANFHLDYDFSQNQGDTITTTVNFDSQPEQFGQTLSMWGSAHSDFAVSILLASTSHDSVYQTPYYSSLNEPTFIDTILVGINDTLIIRMQSTRSFFLNDKPNIRLEIKNTSSNRAVLHATSQNTHLHIWNNVRMNNRYTNWGVPLTSVYPGSLAGNNEYGLGEPAGVGRNVITVASYRAEQFAPNGNLLFGNISGFSSFGPTVDERIKPDIASTGQAVYSSLNSFDYTSNPSFPFEFEGKTYGWASFSGTSMSGPMVAGIVALMLEAHPTLSAVQAKAVLKETARLDDRTGEIGSEGHLQWGWGKANALAAVKAVEVLASTDEMEMEQSLFTVFPNPASDYLTIRLDDVHQSEILEIELFGIDGKISRKFAGDQQNEMTISITDIPNGVYYVRANTQNRFGIKKVVVAH